MGEGRPRPELLGRRAAGDGSPYQKILEKYTYVDRDGRHILCWDIARFVNHSCDPTSRSPGYDLEIAVRDIHPGEQVTDDYGSLNVLPGFETLPLRLAPLPEADPSRRPRCATATGGTPS